MMASLGIDAASLPIIWVAFFSTDRASHRASTYVLCEINVSSVFHPGSKPAEIARLVATIMKQAPRGRVKPVSLTGDEACVKCR
jgi:hypothetical protein